MPSPMYDRVLFESGAFQDVLDKLRAVAEPYHEFYRRKRALPRQVQMLVEDAQAHRLWPRCFCECGAQCRKLKTCHKLHPFLPLSVTNEERDVLHGLWKMTTCCPYAAYCTLGDKCANRHPTTSQPSSNDASASSRSSSPVSNCSSNGSSSSYAARMANLCIEYVLRDPTIVRTKQTRQAKSSVSGKSWASVVAPATTIDSVAPTLWPRHRFLVQSVWQPAFNDVFNTFLPTWSHRLDCPNDTALAVSRVLGIAHAGDALVCNLICMAATLGCARLCIDAEVPGIEEVSSANAVVAVLFYSAVVVFVPNTVAPHRDEQPQQELVFRTSPRLVFSLASEVGRRLMPRPDVHHMQLPRCYAHFPALSVQFFPHVPITGCAGYDATRVIASNALPYVYNRRFTTAFLVQVGPQDPQMLVLPCQDAYICELVESTTKADSSSSNSSCSSCLAAVRPLLTRLAHQLTSRRMLST